MTKVTSANFGSLLIEGLREAVAVSKGEVEPVRAHLRPLSSAPVSDDSVEEDGGEPSPNDR